MAATNMAGPVPSPFTQNLSAGSAVLMSPFSGPRGAPFADTAASGLNSTGALNTGIGFGGSHVVGPTAPGSITDAGFLDDSIPGTTQNTISYTYTENPIAAYQNLGLGTTKQNASTGTATTAVLTAIGGGKSTANVDGNAPTVPYVAQPLLAFGAGGSRDAGAGPAFTGFSSKMVTATGTVANGAVIETGFINRVSDGTQLVPAGAATSMLAGQSTFGSSTAASPAVT